jgi:hypothetical protein
LKASGRFSSWPIRESHSLFLEELCRRRLTDALCDDLRPELVGVVDALAALNAQRERERFVGLRKTVRAIVRHWRRIDGCGDSLDVVASRSRAIYSRDQRPAGDPRLRPHPASIPDVFPDYFAGSLATCQTARATSKGRGVIPVEGTSAPWHYTTFPEALHHWQSLAAGGVALIAALVAIFGAEFVARCKERREIEALRASLAGEIPCTSTF